MFHGPGSAIRFCLVDEAFVRSHYSQTSTTKTSSSSAISSADVVTSEAKMPRCWSRGQNRAFEEAWEREEESWKVKERCEKGDEGTEESEGRGFERFRRVGSSGM
jgi:ATP-dependent Clp protease ATP-binding subunit ClpX